MHTGCLAWKLQAVSLELDTLCRAWPKAAASQAEELSWGMCSTRESKENHPIPAEQVAGGYWGVPGPNQGRAECIFIRVSKAALVAMCHGLSAQPMALEEHGKQRSIETVLKLPLCICNQRKMKSFDSQSPWDGNYWCGLSQCQGHTWPLAPLPQFPLHRGRKEGKNEHWFQLNSGGQEEELI